MILAFWIQTLYRHLTFIGLANGTSNFNRARDNLSADISLYFLRSFRHSAQINLKIQSLAGKQYLKHAPI